jgi:hypothetical protein
MEKKASDIGFALRKITTEQFAIIEDNFSEKSNIRLCTNFRFGTDNKQRSIAVFTSFVFEADTKPFLIIEAGCYFQIQDTTWEQMLNDNALTLIVPKNLISHLTMLTVGTTRGILHAKTENTCFNRYVIPTINVAEMIKDDVTLNFNAR